MKWTAERFFITRFTEHNISTAKIRLFFENHKRMLFFLSGISKETGMLADRTTAADDRTYETVRHPQRILLTLYLQRRRFCMQLQRGNFHQLP